MADLETPAKSGAAFGWTICCQSWKTLAFSVVVELLHVINSTVSLFPAVCALATRLRMSRDSRHRAVRAICVRSARSCICSSCSISEPL